MTPIERPHWTQRLHRLLRRVPGAWPLPGWLHDRIFLRPAAYWPFLRTQLASARIVGPGWGPAAPGWLKREDDRGRAGTDGAWGPRGEDAVEGGRPRRSARSLNVLLIDHYWDQDIDALLRANARHRFLILRYQELRELARMHFPRSVLTGLREYNRPDLAAARRSYRRDLRRVVDMIRDVFPFDVVVAPSDAFFWIREFVPEAQARGAPFVVLDREGTISPYYFERHAAELRRECPPIADRLLVWSERQRAFWTLAGAEPETIEVVGQPRSDYWRHPERWGEKAAIGAAGPVSDRRVGPAGDRAPFAPAHAPARGRVPLRREAKLVVFFSFERSAYVPPELYEAGQVGWDELFDQTHGVVFEFAAAHPECDVVVKAHPQQDRLRELERQVRGLRLPNLHLAAGAAVANPLIAHADVVAGFQTTAMVEALIPGAKPVLYPFWGDAVRWAGNLLPFHSCGAMTVARSPIEFRTALERALVAPETLVTDEQLAARRRLVNEWFHDPDGRVCDRVLASLERLVSTARRTGDGRASPTAGPPAGAPHAPAAILKGEDFTARLADICAAPLDDAAVRRARLADAKYQRILIPGLIGGEIQFALLGFVAHALRLRGAEVTALLCDELLPACTMRKVNHRESACRRWCHRNSGPFARAGRLPHRWYGEFITPPEIAECGRLAARLPARELTTFEWRGVPLGEHVPRSIESYFKVGGCDLENPAVLAKAREFIHSALCLTLIGQRALDALRIDKVFMDDGMKVDWGVIRGVARRRGVPVDVVLGAPRGHSLLIEHDRWPAPSDPYPRWSHWRRVPLTAEQERELDEYVGARATRPYEDQAWSNVAPVGDAAEIARRIGLVRRGPCEPAGPPPGGRGGPLVFAAFPNLSWDAAVTTTRPAYATAAEWVLDTVRFFASRPDVQLVVKVHPAERHQGALDSTAGTLAERFGPLPPNVRLLEPETPITAHDVLRACDVALVYTSTVGVEAAYFGKPVVNVGGGWHAGRGWSLDAATPVEYRAVLERLCAGVPAGEAGAAERARRYAYMVFFRCALPIRHYSALFPNVTSLNLTSLAELLPGRDATIDAVCRGVLCDEAFEACAPGRAWRAASHVAHALGLGAAVPRAGPEVRAAEGYGHAEPYLASRLPRSD